MTVTEETSVLSPEPCVGVEAVLPDPPVAPEPPIFVDDGAESVFLETDPVLARRAKRRRARGLDPVEAELGRAELELAEVLLGAVEDVEATAGGRGKTPGSPRHTCRTDRRCRGWPCSRGSSGVALLAKVGLEDSISAAEEHGTTSNDEWST